MIFRIFTTLLLILISFLLPWQVVMACVLLASYFFAPYDEGVLVGVIIDAAYAPAAGHAFVATLWAGACIGVGYAFALFVKKYVRQT